MTIVTGLVDNVQGDTCDVTREGLPTLLDVSLTAINQNSNSYIRITPKQGSVVAVALVNGLPTEGVIIAHSEIEKVEILINQNSVVIDQNGVSAELSTGKFSIKNQADDLKAIISDLIQAISQITIPLAPSGTGVPANVAAFPPIAQRLNLLFN